jgi:ankyrin repeat protein
MDAQDAHGWTALMVAARKDVSASVEVLLQNGARVDIHVRHPAVPDAQF